MVPIGHLLGNATLPHPNTIIIIPLKKAKKLRPPSKGRLFLVLHPNNSAAAGRWRGYFKLLEHFVSGTVHSQKILLGCLCENFSWVFSVTLQHIRRSRVCKMLDTYCHPRSSMGTEDEVAEQRTRPRRNPLRRTFWAWNILLKTHDLGNASACSFPQFAQRLNIDEKIIWKNYPNDSSPVNMGKETFLIKWQDRLITVGHRFYFHFWIISLFCVYITNTFFILLQPPLGLDIDQIDKWNWYIHSLIDLLAQWAILLQFHFWNWHLN